ncbi:family 16 glycoside hydrolase [uncultured Chitinophaga sp.]|jgi:Domain of Unknown Function (DUF1080).|uniref:family 16 glycoside hydrolase n=1 Tax=uncultured Chitinophaga sp. TaxID=339340 RepID=UPI0026319272|nr:family 16 glycoside hydrolase [uncultured Chitinophaga sp.]
MSLRSFLLTGIVTIMVFGCSSPPAQQEEQIQSLPMEILSLDQLDAFAPAKGAWQLAGNVYANPDQPYSMELAEGSGILAGIHPSNAADTTAIHTKWEHRDMDLELDFMLSAGAAGAIVFQNDYPLLLTDSWLKDSATADLCGAVPGQPPLLNACKAPGLWQHLEIKFRAKPAGQQYAAQFEMVKLNGSIIHDTTLQRMLPAEGTLGFRVTKGSIAFRNIRYKTYNDERVKLADVQYRVYKGVFKNHDTLQQFTPVRTGRTDSLTYRVGDKRGHLLLEGKLIVPVTGQYVFRIQAGGPICLKIDTVEIASNGGTRDFQRPFYGDTVLQQGEHAFQLSYANYDESMVLLYEGPHIPFTALTTPASERSVEADPLMEYVVKQEAVTQRGFMRHHGKVNPYSMAIGIPGGLNYAYDMVNYSPLMAWRGRYLDVAEMWHERGEKQLAKPLGAVLELAGVPCIAALSSPDADWPDAIREDSSSYTNRGYRLLPNGLPVFFYTLHQWQVEDQLSPREDGKGLNRDVTVITQEAAKETGYWLLASGGLIEQLPDGSYAVDDKSYYIKTDGDVQLQQHNHQYRLLAPLPSGTGSFKIHYSISW